ncbi:MAG: recombinase family protein [Ktedonobacteraceae bacterium]|nr:recombinase family protein [Ktedonobacteraceae bacterium]
MDDTGLNEGDTIIYCRVSRHTRTLGPGSATEHLQAALDAQRQQCEEFAAQLGYKVAGYIEEMADGVDAEREGLQDLYIAAGYEGIKYVLVSDPTRLSIDAQTAALIESRLAAAGVEVLYALM